MVRIMDKNGDEIQLDGSQRVAMWRYAEAFGPSRVPPAFIVEGPLGSGKTFLAAAMAVSYCRSGVGGLQLLLCPTESTLQVLEHTLESLATCDMRILSLDQQSVFSVFHEGDKENNAALQLHAQLQMRLAQTTTDQQRGTICKQLERVYEASLAVSGRLDIMLATPEQVLEQLIDGDRSIVKWQLQREVTRVVIDHGEQVTEASFNALILAFPRAKFVVLGDSQQLLPPSYTPGDLPSELAAAPALQLLKKRGNLPLIRLFSTHRTTRDKSRHVADVFYGRAPFRAADLEDHDYCENYLSLSSVCPGVTRNLVYGQLQDSTSSEDMSNVELGAMEKDVRRLDEAGHDHQSVMVVAFCKSQRDLAKARLPFDYQVLAVEEAQGREANIVILLTISRSQQEEDSLMCPRRVNIAVSRHRDALLIFGTEGLSSMDPWNRLLPPYFDHVCFSSN
ncbi:hypothetical protein PMAYCL1PPCAC_30791 [Pristionchus mayeri]|uniref:DNA2/NAM7 helicase-like C-terminal domain-containing protein n=1 Tax=Pristionchus mayeri TaxID=1317129 RepID=A0AAN5DCP3_9BILA|nr:hypothetical protein PMAYCL1PPCAC_30791 [Pristionchus mayeri]